MGHGAIATYGDEATPESADAIETTFSLERDLQRALRTGIEQIEQGFKITDGGKERAVSFGRIDITAEDSAGATVVIELKAGAADRDAIAQVLSYMGDITQASKAVRGIVIAGDFSPAAVAAARAVKNVKLMKYKYRFGFETIEP